MRPMIGAVIRFFEQDLDRGDNLDADKVQHNPDRPDPWPKRHKTDKNQRPDTPTRVQQQVGSHQTEDRSARANAGDTRVRLNQDKKNMSPCACQQIKSQEPPRTTGVFHTSPKNPERQHVSNQVKKAAVQKYRSDIGKCAATLRAQDQARRSGILHEERPVIVADNKYFHVKNETIYENEYDGHDGEK